MKHFILSMLAAVALLALPTAASAKSIQYDFTMTVTKVWDTNGTESYADYNGRESAYSYGIFDGITAGSKIDVSIDLDTGSSVDGDSISSDVLQVSITGGWGSTYGFASYWETGDTYVWRASSSSNSSSLDVNGLAIDGGVTAIEDIYLVFSSDAPWTLAEGYLDFRVENGGASRFLAEYVPTSVPELDPASGMTAMALLGGGVAIVLARRRDEATFAG